MNNGVELKIKCVRKKIQKVSEKFGKVWKELERFGKSWKGIEICRRIRKYSVTSGKVMEVWSGLEWLRQCRKS